MILIQPQKPSDTALFGKYFNAMLENGVYLAPSQFESLFLSTSIDEDIADKIIEANLNLLKLYDFITTS
jgi:glutamate-1-semialdehyde 2,1-aminomutase